MRFEYDQNDSCPCGTKLDGSAGVVTRELSWGRLRFVRCGACASWIQSPRISMASLSAWYDSDTYQVGSGSNEGVYLDYAASEAQRRTEAGARVRRDLQPHLPSRSRVLEIGCATGSMVAALHEAGYDVIGVDLSSEFVKQARTFYPGLDFREGHFGDLELPEQTIDAVLLLGTMSNLLEPYEHLVHLRRLLKPGGLLYFNWPAADSLVARIYGGRYWMFTPSACTFLTRRGCLDLLGRAGFQVERVCGDRQRPTISKLIGHMKLRALYPIVKSLGIATWTPPVSLPIPGVLTCWARNPRPGRPGA